MHARQGRRHRAAVRLDHLDASGVGLEGPHGHAVRRAVHPQHREGIGMVATRNGVQIDVEGFRRAHHDSVSIAPAPPSGSVRSSSPASGIGSQFGGLAAS